MRYPGLNLKDLTDEQLQKKLADISSKLSRSGIRSDILDQFRSIYSAIRDELQERTFKKSIEQDPKWKSGVVFDTTDENSEKDDFDKLIKIN